MYDVLVIGVRCAGSPTAMLLARKGYRVLLVDRASFPSAVINNSYIQQPGVAWLKRWGLLAQVRASNCPPIRQWTFDVGPFALKGTPPPAGDVVEAYAPRRRVIDQIGVDAAVAAGVELREGFAVQEIVREGERVTGIRGRARGRATVTEKARIVVGADGTHSLVARTVQAPTYYAKPARACYYYSYWSGLPMEGVEIYSRDSRAVGGFPTNAFRDAALLAEALADYERQRNEAVLPMYEFTCQLAALEPPAPEQLQLFTALRGNQVETDRFFGVLAGTVAISEFFAPEHLQQIIAGRKI